jgi:hypothetical protein
VSNQLARRRRDQRDTPFKNFDFFRYADVHGYDQAYETVRG